MIENKFNWNDELIQQCIDKNQFEKLNIKDKNNFTGFLWICMFSSDMAWDILERDDIDIDFNTQDNAGWSSFIYTCGEEPEIASAILRKDNINYNLKENFGNTGFILACQLQPHLAVEILEKDDVDFNIQNKDGMTGFMFSCMENPHLIIPMIEDSRIDTTLKNNQGQTAWDIAKEYNPESFKIYKSYIEHQQLDENYNTQHKKSKPIL